MTEAKRRMINGYEAQIGGASNPRGLLHTLIGFYEKDDSNNVNNCPGTRLLVSQISFIINGNENYDKINEDFSVCRKVYDEREAEKMKPVTSMIDNVRTIVCHE